MVGQQKKYLHIALLFAVTFLLYVPFVNKALHIDGPVTLYIAEQILQNPLNPPAGTYGPHLWPWNHTELSEKSAFRATPHPPLVSYWLALAISKFGTDEKVVNWSMFPFYLGAVLFFYGLCRVLQCRYHLQIALLFAVSPMLMVNAQNAMYDVPLAMFIIGAFYFLMREKAGSDAAIAGLFAGLACLVKFTAGTAVIAGMLYYILRREWKSLIWFTVMAGSCNAIWLIHNMVLLDNWQLTGNGHARFLWGDLRYRAERMFSFVGGTVLLPVLPLFIWWKAKVAQKTGCVIILTVGVWSALLMHHLHYSLTSAVVYWCSASAGGVMVIMSVAIIGKEAGRMDCFRTKWKMLMLHVALQMVGGLFLTLYASRYSLAFIFVVLIAVALLLEQKMTVRFQHLLWTIAITTSLGASLLLSIGDYRIVDAERKIASDVKKKYGAQSRMFYQGRLGYLYYMYRAGGQSLLDAGNQPKSGDLVVRNCFYPNDDREYFDNNNNKIELIDTMTYPLFPVRTIGGRAGFYGNDRLPCAWVTIPSVRVFEIYRLR